jgi:hypothetical protein
MVQIQVMAHLTNPFPFSRISSMTNSKNLRRYRLLFVLLLACGLSAWMIAKGSRTYRAANDLKTSAAQLAASMDADLGSLDFNLLGEEVKTARQAAESLQLEIAPFTFLTDRLGWLPWIGPTIQAGGPAVDFAVGLTTMADELLAALTPLLDPSDDVSETDPIDPAQRVLRVLETAQPHLQNAERALEEALAARERFSLEVLPSSLRDPLEKVDRILPQASQVLKGLEVLPEMLGADVPRTYLILAQNQDELRATGGFISGAGRLTLDGGQIIEMAIRDSYAADDLSKPYPTPPEPLRHYMGASYWLLRDANWSPDFPTAAQRAIELYEIGQPDGISGVIAFDQMAVQRLLAAVGSVELEGFPEPITADNVIGYMQQSWGSLADEEAAPDWWAHRKDFMGQLGGALIEAVQGSDDPSMLMALGREAYKLLREKHVLLYFEDEALQSTLSGLGLDGALKPGDGDFLMLVDSNLGFNKVDALIERQIDYAVDLSDLFQPQASLQVTYQHTWEGDADCEHGAFVRELDYRDLQHRCYWNYFRVYVPTGVIPISGTAPPVSADWLLTEEREAGGIQVLDGERDTTVFSGIFVLPPGETSTVQIEYILPQKVLQQITEDRWTYTLQLAKQPGTHGVPVKVSVLLPEGFSSIEGQTSWEIDADGVAQWEGRLWVDQVLSLSLTSERLLP